MRAPHWLLMLLTAALVAGCAGYRLGPTGGQTAGARSIQIAAVSNQTLEPRLSETVTAALRKQFQRDATFRLATRGPADLVVTTTITGYQRQEQSLVPEDVLTVKDYRIHLVARVMAREVASGRVILDQSVRGQTLLRTGNDLASAERQALPLLAEDLARNVVTLVADGTW